MITKEMTVSEVLEKGDCYQQVFEKYLLTCAGCPGADMETIEEAAKGHGVNLHKLLDELNKAK